jgi:DNA-binding XRE family transcriptional regulator
MILAKKQALKTAMFKLGMTQQDLALTIKKGTPHISMLINGKIGTSPRTAKTICKILNGNFEDFFEVVEKTEAV